jgi:hypothetical protein
VLVNVVNTTPQAFLAVDLLSYSPKEVEERNSRCIWAWVFEVYTPFDGQEGPVHIYRVLLVECSEQVQISCGETMTVELA